MAVRRDSNSNNLYSIPRTGRPRILDAWYSIHCLRKTIAPASQRKGWIKWHVTGYEVRRLSWNFAVCSRTHGLPELVILDDSCNIKWEYRVHRASGPEKGCWLEASKHAFSCNKGRLLEWRTSSIWSLLVPVHNPDAFRFWASNFFHRQHKACY